MNELAFIRQDDVFTDTWIIAQNVGYTHRTIAKHIQTYRKRFEKMGGTYYTHTKHQSKTIQYPTAASNALDVGF